ncbi:MAG: DNA replication/repair protein RecF [Flavobacteriales bacterium]|nr:DNA replication/repair protein RecF [Flavobacteriales bacterium]
MYLKKLSLVNFKNYEAAELNFTRGINCFVGNNGVGKTNLLDAIHYLSFCKSFINPIESQNVRYESDFFIIQGNFDLKGKKEQIHCGFKKGKKKQFQRNKKEYSRLADHIGLLPVVLISPEDTALIQEGSDLRRKFIDTIIAQLDHVYLDKLIAYNRILSQRNALLKRFAESRSFDQDAIDVWDEQLVDLGTVIHEKRAAFLESFTPIFQKHFEFISQGEEEVSLAYRSQLNEEHFSTVLAAAMSKDRVLQYSTAGIHRDDLVFTMGEHPIKKLGSQGQRKSFVIALKLAQFDFLRSEKGYAPLLLLDDIFDKLDPSRVKQLMELVSGENYGQIFITHTHEDRLNEVLAEMEDVKVFQVSSGSVHDKTEKQNADGST